MLVTVLGIVTLVRLVQSSNAPVHIFVKPSGMMIEAIFSRYLYQGPYSYILLHDISPVPEMVSVPFSSTQVKSGPQVPEAVTSFFSSAAAVERSVAQSSSNAKNVNNLITFRSIWSPPYISTL